MYPTLILPICIMLMGLCSLCSIIFRLYWKYNLKVRNRLENDSGGGSGTGEKNMENTKKEKKIGEIL